MMTAVRTRPTPSFEFEALEALPCGCVAAAYRSRQWDVSLVSLEAKGPHCLLPRHSTGEVLRLGEPYEPEFTQDEA